MCFVLEDSALPALGKLVTDQLCHQIIITQIIKRTVTITQIIKKNEIVTMNNQISYILITLLFWPFVQPITSTDTSICDGL